MRTSQLVEIQNVKRANRVLKSLLDRTRSESVGIGLFYGRAGLGKTRWGFNTAIGHGYIYFRLIENMTVKDFLREILRTLKYKGLVGDVCNGSKKELYDQIIEVLHHHPETVIFIDEIDYGFSNQRVLASIRDLADQSFATFVLIGMQNSKSLLLRQNAHYFDRCNGFCEFRSLNLSDIGLILSEVCEHEIDSEVVSFIHKKSNGTIRLVIKYIEVIERFCKKHAGARLTHSDLCRILDTVENS
jgi:DNA polymerase III delta prime subunit